MPISILATLTGTAGNDTLTGDAAADSLSGLGGNDRLLGNGGNDTLLGATGADTLDGGFGADRAEGGDGADSILGAGGNDTLKGGVGADLLKGGTGFDIAVFAGNYADYSFGQSGGYLTVIDRKASNGDEGPDRLIGIERLQFADRTVNVNSEIRLGATPAGADGSTGVTALADGGFVIAWQRSVGETNGEIHAQRFAQDWHAVGTEIVLEGRIADGGQLAVAALENGGFVLAWHQFDGVAAAPNSVHALRFDNAGAATGAEIVVGATGNFAPAGIAAAGVPGGGFVVSWGKDSGAIDGYEVLARRYGPKGGALGAAFSPATTTANDQQNPSIAVLKGGGFVIAWESFIDGSSIYDILARRFDATGNAVGAVFRVNSGTPGPQQGAAVAALNDGGFVIAWNDQGFGVENAILAQRFDATAKRVGDTLTANQTAFDPETRPSASALAGGGFVITWESDPGATVLARRFGANGTALGDESPVNQAEGGERDGSDVAGLADGSFVIAWSGAGSGDDAGAFYALHDAAGTAQGLTQAEVTGTAADDVLDLGGPGAGYAEGGPGDDIFIVDDPGDVVVERPGEGNDTVKSSASYTLPANVERLELTGTANIDGTGNELPNELLGNSGNNVLDGRGGADTMRGGGGDDTYYATEENGALDNVIEEPGGGHDKILADVSGVTALPNNVEDLDLLGSATGALGNASDNFIRGNELPNSLSGFSGNDTLDGGAGGDTLEGADGDDVYYVDDNSSLPPGYYDDWYYPDGIYTGDVVNEGVDGGYDIIVSLIDFAMPNNVEGIGLAGNAVSATGNGGPNRMTGNDIGNVLTGGGGDDTLDGGTGADQLEGGSGNDFYLVDNASDTLVELFGDGNDWVQSLISYILGANIERLQLIGTADLSGLGNALDNWMEGNSGNNTLDGGAGADRMLGGAGNDTYYVENAGDEVIEQAAAALIPIGGEPDPSGSGSNIDTVIAQVSYTLRSNVENLQLAGSGNLSGTGNGLDNLLTGNNGANTLKGQDGADVLDGGAGNDSLDGGAGKDTLGGGAGNDTLVGAAGDTLLEAANQGTDTVKTALAWTLANNFENLLLTGSANLKGTGNSVANTLTGNSGANALSGLGGNDKLLGAGGNDTLAGGAGNDTLTGGAGADVFLFDTALAANKDTITDFAIGSDKIRLDDDVFKAFDASTATTLASGQFRSGPQATAAQDADDRIVYNSTTGALYYDADGLGGAGAVQFAVMGTTTHPNLTAADFRIGD